MCYVGVKAGKGGATNGMIRGTGITDEAADLAAEETTRLADDSVARANPTALEVGVRSLVDMREGRGGGGIGVAGAATMESSGSDEGSPSYLCHAGASFALKFLWLFFCTTSCAARRDFRHLLARTMWQPRRLCSRGRSKWR